MHQAEIQRALRDVYRPKGPFIFYQVGGLVGFGGGSRKNQRLLRATSWYELMAPLM